jgi:hypothetical protein
MDLFASIIKICHRLAPYGWREIFQRHGLDIMAADLRKELHRNIAVTIDRRVPGFMDFIGLGFSAIHPYNPAMSLLYHALASPNVHPDPGNSVHENRDAYPTLTELDTIENYIFSSDHPENSMVLRDKKFFEDHFRKGTLCTAVFAYQYRPGSKTAHGHYADIAYSRTGIARMGTAAAQYVPSARSYWPVPEGGENGFGVMGVRYGLFIAELREKVSTEEVMLAKKIDSEKYIFPLHKIFPGKDCVVGLEIPAFDFHEEHISEKLKLLFQSREVKKTTFDIDRAPFVRRSGAGLDLELHPFGSSVMLLPKPLETMISVAKQDDRTVHFKVQNKNIKEDNRFSTSLQIENHKPPAEARIAPEYVNIRFELKPRSGKQKTEEIVNLFDEFSAALEDDFLKKINDGGYEAVVFTDGSCDGCIDVKFSDPFDWLSASCPAYSIVAAPDFFPLCDQSDIANWEHDIRTKDQFREGGSDPLFLTRKFVNPTIQSPVGKGSAFAGVNKENIKTTTAIVSMSVLSSGNPEAKNNDRQVSWLPDAASGYFAPGWDVTLVKTEEFPYDYLSTAGLGSPFPEDSKLCAALNSFWPAVAPDASRTFVATRDLQYKFFSTALPLTDEELGLHPLHPMVLAKLKKSTTGWDGEQGPFFENNRRWVNYTSIDRSDYTANMLKNLFTVENLSRIDSSQWIDRMMAMRNCIFALPPKGDHVSTSKLIVVSFETIELWEKEPPEIRIDKLLNGPGFVFECAHLKGKEKLTDDPKRRQMAVDKSFICMLSDRFLFWKDNSQNKFTRLNRGTMPLKW